MIYVCGFFVFMFLSFMDFQVVQYHILERVEIWVLVSLIPEVKLLPCKFLFYVYVCVSVHTHTHHTHTHTDTHFSPLLGVDCRILVPWLRIKLTLAVKVQSPSASLDNQGIFSLCIFLIFCWIIHSLTELSTSPPSQSRRPWT